MKYRSAPEAKIRLRPLEMDALYAYLMERSTQEGGEMGGFLHYIAQCGIAPYLVRDSSVRHAHVMEQGEAMIDELREGYIE
jgi:hypothetical protein